MGRGAGQNGVVLYENTVVHDRHARGRRDPARGVESRAMKDDVVGLPLAGRPARVHERRVLPVDRRGVAVSVRDIVIRVEYLNLVSAHQKHAAVAALLPIALWRRRRAPLDVKLYVA